MKPLAARIDSTPPRDATSAAGNDLSMDAPILRFDRYNLPGLQTSLAGPGVWLQITRGRVRQPVRPVAGPVFLIGTATDCDLVLGDKSFPEAYAYLLVQDDGVSIRRVGDGPELLVNDEPIEATALASGDRLAFGPFELAVQIPLTNKATIPPSPSLPIGNWPWLADLAEV
jgi:hypothetical protein